MTIQEVKKVKAIMTYGSIIKQKRKKLKMPQAKLAKKSRISQGNISKIENGLIDLKAMDLFAIARVLKIKCKEFERVSYE